MDKSTKTLQDIFDDADEFGLLDVKPAAASPANEEKGRLIAAFQDIIAFYDKHKRAPQQGNNIQERQLCAWLTSIRDNSEKIATVQAYDTFGLLTSQKKIANSLEDIFEDADLDLFNNDTAGLFDYKHIKQPHERAETDFVAQRKACKDFSKYEPLFKAVQKDLKEHQRQLVAFKQDNLRAGDFYVHNGVLLYLENVAYKEEVQTFKSGNRNRKDGRTRVIFENGTESNMLYRSLYKVLLANGKALSRHQQEAAELLADNYNHITEADKAVGYVYILQSKSTSPSIKALQNLYKIGYSTTSVEDRIKKAAQETTYLLADVTIKATYKCYNMNPQKFEQLIHTFFGKVCLNVDVFDHNGQRYTPREWFIVPLQVIDEAIGLIVSGKILAYRYDDNAEEIVLR